MISNKMNSGIDGVISVDEIKLILERYRIGKKPLAKLLGWGETTIIRYMDGDVPTIEYSNKLKAILEDPGYYYELLSTKGELLTNIAFKKSKKAVLSKIMETNIYAAAYHTVNRCGGDISPGYIQYILYYTQAFFLALQDKELFQEECSANGGVMPFSKLYESMKGCGIHSLEGVDEFLSKEEIKFIDTVTDSLLWYGPKALSKLLRHEKSKMKISRDQYNNKILSKDSIKGYYKEVIRYYHIKNIHEIHKYFDKIMPQLRKSGAIG